MGARLAVLAVAAAAVLETGCSPAREKRTERMPGSSPAATILAIEAAARAGDVESLVHLTAPSYLADAAAEWERRLRGPEKEEALAYVAETLRISPEEAASLSAREIALGMIEASVAADPDFIEPAKDLRILEERIDEDRAVLLVRNARGEESDWVLVRVDGRWYLATGE